MKRPGEAKAMVGESDSEGVEYDACYFDRRLQKKLCKVTRNIAVFGATHMAHLGVMQRCVRMSLTTVQAWKLN